MIDRPKRHEKNSQPEIPDDRMIRRTPVRTGRFDDGKRRRTAELVVNIGLFFNIFLAAVKVITGIIGHSRALLADGINSVSDVIYFIVVKIFVRLSDKPADQEHPYGHHQLESIAALVVGAFVITTGAAIFWDAVNTVFDLFTGAIQPKPIRFFSLSVALGTIIVKVFLMLHAGSMGKKTGNLAIKALAKDHRNDIFSSAGAAAGILFSLLGASWVDPVAGAVVSVIVAKTGFDILREASSDLMDNVPGDEIAARIHEILNHISGVITVEDIRAHRFGPYMVVNLTIGVDGRQTVAAGDQIADSVEDALTGGIEMLHKVYVHYHPAKGR